MIHWSKQKDMKEIKNKINNDSELDDMPLPEIHEPISQPLPERIETPTIVKSTSVSDIDDQHSSHVFVKVDRYDTILEKLDGVKDAVNNMTNVLSTMIDVDDVRREVADMLRNSLDHMSQTLATLDGELIRPENSKEYEKKLDPQMKKIRQDLENLKDKVNSL